MDRKGIAVSQIVLLVLGILVLAVVAYLLYTNFLTSSGSFDVEKCRASVIRQCTAWSVSLTANKNSPAPTNWGTECGGAAGTNAGIVSSDAKKTCTNVGVSIP